MDLTASDTSILSGALSGSTVGSPIQSFTFTGTDAPWTTPSLTYECRIDAGIYTACNSGSYTTVALTDGTHTFDVRSTDEAGNTDATPSSTTFIVDAPIVVST